MARRWFAEQIVKMAIPPQCYYIPNLVYVHTHTSAIDICVYLYMYVDLCMPVQVHVSAYMDGAVYELLV
jgi:hypothetical protein